MRFEDKLEQLQKQEQELKQELRQLEEEWDAYDDKIDEVEGKQREVDAQIKELHKTNQEEGFIQWKSQLEDRDLNTRPYEFNLTQEQTLKIKYLEHLHANQYNGAIGGGTSVSFTLTSIGNMVSVTINGTEYNLTDYDNF